MAQLLSRPRSLTGGLSTDPAELQKTLKHPGLKEELGKRGLKNTGKTVELAERLSVVLQREREDPPCLLQGVVQLDHLASGAGRAAELMRTAPFRRLRLYHDRLEYSSAGALDTQEAEAQGAIMLRDIVDMEVLGTGFIIDLKEGAGCFVVHLESQTDFEAWLSAFGSALQAEEELGAPAAPSRPVEPEETVKHAPRVGDAVEVVKTIRYEYTNAPHKNYELPSGLRGRIAIVDDDGDLQVDWEGKGKKWLLQRELGKVSIKRPLSPERKARPVNGVEIKFIDEDDDEVALKLESSIVNFYVNGLLELHNLTDMSTDGCYLKLIGARKGSKNSVEFCIAVPDGNGKEDSIVRVMDLFAPFLNGPSVDPMHFVDADGDDLLFRLEDEEVNFYVNGILDIRGLMHIALEDLHLTLRGIGKGSGKPAEFYITLLPSQKQIGRRIVATFRRHASYQNGLKQYGK